MTPSPDTESERLADRQVERFCDMRQGYKLKVLRDGEGDILVSVLPESHRYTEHCVEFCNSGSKSYRTYRALLELEKAMRLDAEDHRNPEPKPFEDWDSPWRYPSKGDGMPEEGAWVFIEYRFPSLFGNRIIRKAERWSNQDGRWDGSSWILVRWMLLPPEEASA